jgi:hypothetical protein
LTVTDYIGDYQEGSEARALFCLSEQIRIGLKYLGTGDTGDSRVAVEFLATTTRAGLDNVAESIRELAEAIRNSGM